LRLAAPTKDWSLCPPAATALVKRWTTEFEIDTSVGAIATFAMFIAIEACHLRYCHRLRDRESVGL
jgi:hypothetical protein